ncbi:MAG: nucleoside phosphorylase [Bacteroidia bacterium]|nr:nucleoside phosphorylase [Bacteroidia bacterium]MCF8446640.1 nucleoside phosphorylase [Bacteroidia bacterium]
MNTKIPSSELILNADGSVYHLNILPEDLADTVLLVGDPERVPEVSKYFDKIEIKKQKREFITHTGYIGSKRFSVISTGIGTDNIDIVLNELDILSHVNMSTREIKSEKRDLNLVRIGTSGALQADIEVDSILVSTHGLGLDHLIWYYDVEPDFDVSYLQKDLGLDFLKPYLFNASQSLLSKFDERSIKGITATCSGFYGPQGRMLRAGIKSLDLVQNLSNARINGLRVTNFEMETAAILGLSKLFGFQAIAVNAIVANRINHNFSTKAHQTIDQTIKYTLEALS